MSAPADTEHPWVACGPGPGFGDQISEFERLRERAHEQIAALSVTVAQLERLRNDIEQHLPQARR